MEVTIPELLSLPAVEALLADLTRAGQDESARVWVLRGQEGTFCRGLDLEGLADAEGLARGTRGFAACLALLATAPRPTVALVDGQALGGGVGLAAACDVVVATERSSFGLPESLFGMLPALVMPLLLQRLSPQKARLLAMTGVSRGADWAREHGLVDELVRPAEAERVVQRYVRDLGRGLPGGTADLRAWMAQAPRLELSEALERAAVMTGQRASDRAVRERIRAFFEEGTAPWTSEEGS